MSESDPVMQRMMAAFLFTATCSTLWWNLQWQRVMRFWVRPPNRPVTQYGFRIFFALNFTSAMRSLISHFRRYPLNSDNAGPTILAAALWLFAVGTMTVVVFKRVEREDRKRTHEATSAPPPAPLSDDKCS